MLNLMVQYHGLVWRGVEVTRFGEQLCGLRLERWPLTQERLRSEVTWRSMGIYEALIHAKFDRVT